MPDTSQSSPEPEPTAETATAGTASDKHQGSNKLATAASRTADNIGVIAGLAFWIILAFLIWVWVRGPRHQAEIFLQAASAETVQVKGSVLIDGAAAAKGKVYIVFEDPKKNRHLAGEVLETTENGSFATETGLAMPAGSPPTSMPLRVIATFSGQQPQKDKSPTVISGKAVLYLNYPPPVGQWTVWGCVLISAILAFGLITLFTGDLTRRKSRVLFSITYIMTVMSLAVPIVTIVLVSKSQYAVEMMEEAPVGLIKGTAKGVQNPQWLINVGGAVIPKQLATVSTAPVSRPQANSESNTLPPASVPSPTPTAETPKPDELRQTPGFAMVLGGLTVPFYVVILAMLGAGINMTKKVPDIQKRYDMGALPADQQSMVTAALTAPVRAFSSTPQEHTLASTTAVSGIRKDLIDTYMGLISAPFLAVAVYYLLQIIATNIAEPVLVLVAFATGFISDSIVTAITNFASEMITRRPRSSPNGPEHPSASRNAEVADEHAAIVPEGETERAERDT